MGNLVFQATLGGQVNLVGPNTASTLNINVPATAGTMVTTGDSGTVTGTMLASTVFSTPAALGSVTPAAVTGTNVVATGGLYAKTTMSATYTDGIVADYTTGLGRISVGTSDGLAIYNGGVANTELMRVDSSGNVGIGTSSPTFSSGGGLHVNVAGAGPSLIHMTTGNQGTASNNGLDIKFGAGDASFWNYANGIMTFATNNAERARIDSSGNLLVGTTSNYGGGRLDVAWDGTANAAAVRASSASFAGAGFIVYADRNTTNSTFKGIAYYNVGAGAYKFIVQDSGNVQNVNNSYGAISDIKLKENVTDATPKLAQLNQVRVVNYNLIGDSTKQIGVIAQELEQVFPSMIDEEVDRDLEGNELGTTTKSVKYSVFVPMLIKAIQEQQALITQLQADVAALKAPQ